MSFSRDWVSSNIIRTENEYQIVRQVYCWLFSRDQKLILVCKPNGEWQFPGGKPESGENITQTAIREVREETGLILDIPLQQFGYYLITEADQSYLQVRLLNRLAESEEYTLSPELNDEIRIAMFVSLAKAYELIPWLKQTQEHEDFLKLIG